MRSIKAGACAIGLVLLPLTLVSAQDAAQSLALVDDLEFRVEIGQHERLIKRRTKDGTTLAAFASDGCSGNLSTGWELVSRTVPAVAKHHGDRPPWESCCVAHDRLYHGGGAANLDAKGSFVARRVADEQLRRQWQQQGIQIERSEERAARGRPHFSIDCVMQAEECEPLHGGEHQDGVAPALVGRSACVRRGDTGR